MLESIADARLLLWLHFMIIGRRTRRWMKEDGNKEPHTIKYKSSYKVTSLLCWTWKPIHWLWANNWTIWWPGVCWEIESSWDTGRDVDKSELSVNSFIYTRLLLTSPHLIHQIRGRASHSFVVEYEWWRVAGQSFSIHVQYWNRVCRHFGLDIVEEFVSMWDIEIRSRMSSSASIDKWPYRREVVVVCWLREQNREFNRHRRVD